MCSSQEPSLIIGKVARVHSGFSPEVTELFYKGPKGQSANPVDRWRVEDDLNSPVVKIMYPPQSGFYPADSQEDRQQEDIEKLAF